MRAVLDTNILVSALISPFGNEALVLNAVQEGRITPCFSRKIIEKYSEVLARPKFSFALPAIDGLVGLLQSRGLLFETPPAIGTSPDPKDEDFIGCALASDAEFLVTGNRRHFPAESYGRARVVSARELIEFLNTQRSR